MCKNNKTSGWTALGGRSMVWLGAKENLRAVWVEESVLNTGICMTLQSNSRTERGRSEARLLEERLICLTAAAEIFVSLVLLSVNRLFSLMQTLTAVQLVFCSAAFQKRKKKKKKEKSSLKSLDPLSFQTRIAVWNCFQSASAPYNGPAMCKPGSSKTYTSPLPRTGLSQGVFCTKAAPAHFLDLCNLFPRTRWVMTDDKRQVQPINRGWRSVRGNGH